MIAVCSSCCVVVLLDDGEQTKGRRVGVVVVVVPGGGLVKAKKVNARPKPVAKSSAAWISGCIVMRESDR